MNIIDQATISVLVQALGLALIANWQKRADEKRDSARAERDADREETKQFRSEVLRRLDKQDEKIDSMVCSQATDMRSDIIHKFHRYLDDLGMASVEEKRALKEQHEEYCRFCKVNNIENEFLDSMIERVMALPER